MGEKRPVKAGKLVVEAIRHLKAERGFTPKEIINYISANHGVSDRMIKCIYTSLKRGAEYGILRTLRGRYTLKASPTSPLLGASQTKDEDLNPEEAKRRGGGGSCKKRKSRPKRRSGKKRCGKKRSRRHKTHKRGKCGKKGRSKSRRRKSRSRKRKCGKHHSRRHHSKRHHSRRHRSKHRSKKHRGGKRRRSKCRC